MPRRKVPGVAFSAGLASRPPPTAKSLSVERPADGGAAQVRGHHVPPTHRLKCAFDPVPLHLEPLAPKIEPQSPLPRLTTVTGRGMTTTPTSFAGEEDLDMTKSIFAICLGLLLIVCAPVRPVLAHSPSVLLTSGGPGEALNLNFFLRVEGSDTECSVGGVFGLKTIHTSGTVSDEREPLSLSKANPFTSFRHVFAPDRGQLRETVIVEVRIDAVKRVGPGDCTLHCSGEIFNSKGETQASVGIKTFFDTTLTIAP